MKKQNGIFGSIRNNKDLYIKEFLKYYNNGLNDTLISKILLVSNTTIKKWRDKLCLSKNFKYTRKINHKEFIDLYNKGFNWEEISKKINISSSAVSDYAKSINLKSNYFLDKSVEPTEIQKSVIFGTVLGDGYLGLPNDSKNAYCTFTHSLKQENYCLWKYNILKNLCSKPRYGKQFHNKTNKYYYNINIRLKSNSYITKYYKLFYKNKIKYINIDVLNSLKRIGLAVWFMDDGYFDNGSYSLSTNCFSNEDINLILSFFKENYNLVFKKHKSNIIRLSSKDKYKFLFLILPYIHNDCFYKLKIDPHKTPLNRAILEKDLPVLSLQEIEDNAKRLEMMLST